ncbi:MAG TPA: DNA topoisomerase 3 [Myxococcota bacterium]|nr:DNA topoisomerase 3 [Myxococcota bacterium]
MPKSLVITEKPSVARDIVAALGGFTEHDGFWESDDWVVTFSVGHIVELLSPEDVDPQYKRWTLDTLPILPDEFKLKQKQGQSERIRTIKKLLERKDVDGVVNACDAGREGELIFREILEYLEKSDKPTRRLWLQSMTQDAIRSGFRSMVDGHQYDGLGAAASCRSRSDWLIGMNATRALTRRLKGRKEKTAWSAGRVQTPTLAIVVDRELEVLAHVPRPYWQLNAKFGAGDAEYLGTWFDPGFSAPEGEERELRDDRIFDSERANRLLEKVTGKAGTARETRKPSRETAPPLFDLTSLQREGNRRFGWSARRTLNAAQRCYEAHKLLTYPRTDSRCLPNDYRANVDEILRTFAGEGPFQAEAQPLVENGLENADRTFDDSKVSDHFAIIPTGKLPDANLSGDDQRLYDLVTRRFLASFHPAAVWTRVERVTEVAGESFRSRARTLDEPGWRAVIGQTEQEDQALPPLLAGQDEAEGVAVRTQEVELAAEKTKPPARITEARLLSLMESAGQDIEDEEIAAAISEKGIGTPATRADVIENLIAKSYLVRAGKSLRPTVKGIRLVDVLRRIKIDRLASAALTGELEYDLRRVERRSMTAKQFMDEIVDYTKQIVDIAVSFQYEDLYPDEESLGKCPLCSRPVFERSWFYRCLEVPGATEETDCRFRIWKDKSGRYMDRQTVRTLLEKGETDELEGFAARDGRTYNARLTLEDGEVVIHGVAGSAGERVTEAPEYDVNDEPLGPCPMGCGSQVVETPTHFQCQAGIAKAAENAEKARAFEAAQPKDAKRRKRWKAAPEDQPCPFLLPRTVCKREITRDEALQFIGPNRKTELLTDFTSRFGRPFSAMLFLKENGRHGFEFQPRQKKEKAAEAAAPTDSAEAATPDGAGETAAGEAGPRKRKAAAKGGRAPGARKPANAEKPEGRKTARRKP